MRTDLLDPNLTGRLNPFSEGVFHLLDALDYLLCEILDACVGTHNLGR